MKFQFPIAVFAAMMAPVSAHANASGAQIAMESTVYVGEDFGAGCRQANQKTVAQDRATSVVHCFKITNTGKSDLTQIVVTNEALGNFFDNSIKKIAPGQSVIVPFKSAVNGNLTHEAVVTAVPADAEGKPIPGAEPVQASDKGEVIDHTVKHEALLKEKRERRMLYTTPHTGTEDCIQDKFTAAGNTDSLLCTDPGVYLKSVLAEETASCVRGEKITVTLDATMGANLKQGPGGLSGINDLGWYIGTDGGDALTGDQCIINGLQYGNEYKVLDPTETNEVGQVFFGAAVGQTDGVLGNLPFGDNDECGDIVVMNAEDQETISLVMPVPIAVEAELTCTDENDSGTLDLPICFTFRGFDFTDSAECTYETNIPAAATGNCFCSRYDVSNIQVLDPTPPDQDDVPC